MITKYLKKTTALAVTICTLITSCALGINGKESNVKKYLKYVIPGGLALATGCILGNSYVSRADYDDLTDEDDDIRLNKILDCLENFKDFKNMSNYGLLACIDNMINNQPKDNKASKIETNRVLIFRDFYQEDRLNKSWFIEEIERGTTMVFLGNIISKGEDEKSLRNLIFVTTLQQLYPEKVIILKGKNENVNSVPSCLKKYMEKRSIYDQDIGKRIKTLLDNLRETCEISCKGYDGKEYNYLFSHKPKKSDANVKFEREFHYSDNEKKRLEMIYLNDILHN